MNKVPGWVFRYVGNKTFDFSSKKKDFLPKNDQIWPKIGIFGQFGSGHAGLFSALLVGRLVVVARRLYLARHLFTLYILYMLYYFLTFTGTFSRCTMRGCRSRPILVYNCILRSNSLLQYNEIHSLFVICSLHSVLQTMRSWIQFNLDFCVTRAQLL